MYIILVVYNLCSEHGHRPLIQEPTSGLDASTALTLMQQMRVCATTFNKTIVTSIHQPSSQVFHMFNNMLLLINGKVRWRVARISLI